MAYKSPKDLAESLSRRKKRAAADDYYVRETFTLPREEAGERLPAQSEQRCSRRRRVKIAAIYGAVLNERGWCYGHQNEANAQMNWHRRYAQSERFTLDAFADFENA
ncbi:hypothetical protein [Afipia felis]|uniref:Uncharacterized protein n=2 Tax=Afipia felis TaxID=1035 RepID=A0A380WAY5_AFIFE|nr:hypothetical protein [Afipia felis]EKS29184.1 hypothetical protein HMPREF9697_01712 [Afipia felis ATCC 53690]SUU77891.1 Uncharacterised protein [Afipia felis]SUU85956.1 Uncharacterised protein [Afipia felis]